MICIISSVIPFGVAQWFDPGTSMLEVLSFKPLASKSKGLVFWIELVAPGLPGASYLSYVVCELLHRSGGFILCTPKRVAAMSFPCHKKNNIISHTFRILVPLSPKNSCIRIRKIKQGHVAQFYPSIQYLINVQSVDKIITSVYLLI